MITIRRPKYVSRPLVWAVLLFFCIVSLSCGSPTADLQAASIHPAIEYSHRTIADKPWSIHIAGIRRNSADLRFVSSLAKGRIYDLATVATQARAVPEVVGRPLLAVNGDFFRIRLGPYRGDPLGLQIARGELLSTPRGTSFWVDKSNIPHIGTVLPRFQVAGPNGVKIEFKINEPLTDNSAVLFTPTMGKSTRTTNAREFVLKRTESGPWLPIRAGMEYSARIESVLEKGNSRIPRDKMILAVGPALLEKTSDFSVGSILTIRTSTTPDLHDVRTAVAGGPVLVKNGEARKWKPPQPRHPRTMIGFNESHYFLVVVDGRQPGLSIGMTYPEMAELMLELGCTDAMNLDGGGSSTFWFAGKVLNSPSDPFPRAVANALILVQTESGNTN